MIIRTMLLHTYIHTYIHTQKRIYLIRSWMHLLLTALMSIEEAQVYEVALDSLTTDVCLALTSCVVWYGIVWYGVVWYGVNIQERYH